MTRADLKPAFGAATLEAHTAGPSMPLRRSLGLALGASLLALALSGCGASALERHTTAAGILHATAGEAASIIEADAQRAADAAIAPCRDEGSEVATCETTLSAAMRPRRRAAAVQRLYAAAVDAYVLAVLTAARGDDPDMALAVRALGRALAVWSELAGLLAEYGVELPDAGPVVRGLLGGGS